MGGLFIALMMESVRTAGKSVYFSESTGRWSQQQKSVIFKVTGC
jgi:hypothetical protein